MRKPRDVEGQGRSSTGRDKEGTQYYSWMKDCELSIWS